MSNSYEKVFNKFAAKWLSKVFKGNWDTDKFGIQPLDYAGLPDGSRLVLLFTQFLMRAYQSADIVPGKRVLFVFVTKKGYWLYQCVYQYMLRHSELFQREDFRACKEFWDKILVKSDRYFTKSPDVSEFADCYLFIIDDIVHTGANFRRMKKLVQENGLTITKYIAFAIENSDEVLIEGIEDIWTCNRLSSNDLGKISIEEIVLFHSLGVPYTIDLPRLKATSPQFTPAEGYEYAFSSGRLSQDVFYRLCNECGQYGWTKTDASYVLNNQNFHTCYFQNPKNPIEKKFKNLLHSLIVECSYREVKLDNGNLAVDVTFFPFAIMRSVKWQELVILFSEAFSPFPYYKNVLPHSDSKPSQALATALYRAMVFYLSGYIAFCFNDGLLKNLGLSLELQTDCLGEHWNDAFLESVKYIFNSPEPAGTGEGSMTNCANIERFYRSDDISSDPKYWNWDSTVDAQTEKLDIYLEMYKFFVKRPDLEKTKCYSFEDLEIEIAGKMGKLVNDPEFKTEFLRALTKLLNQSAISNIVFYDPASEQVVRGFRSGENCALLLPYAQTEVFCAISAYYERCERRFGSGKEADQQCKRNFDYFKGKLQQYISDAGYDFWIDRAEAMQLLDYFNNLPDIGRQIKNRQYIVEEAERDDSYRRASIAKNLIEFAENLELPDE